MTTAVASSEKIDDRGAAGLKPFVADVTDADHADQSADRHRRGRHRAGVAHRYRGFRRRTSVPKNRTHTASA